MNSSFLHFFVVFSSPTDGTVPSHISDGNLYSQSTIQMLIYSSNNFTDTLRNILPAIWTSLSPIILTHKMTHHTTFKCRSNNLPFPFLSLAGGKLARVPSLNQSQVLQTEIKAKEKLYPVLLETHSIVHPNRCQSHENFKLTNL